MHLTVFKCTCPLLSANISYTNTKTHTHSLIHSSTVRNMLHMLHMLQDIAMFALQTNGTRYHASIFQFLGTLFARQLNKKQANEYYLRPKTACEPNGLYILTATTLIIIITVDIKKRASTQY